MDEGSFPTSGKITGLKLLEDNSDGSQDIIHQSNQVTSIDPTTRYKPTKYFYIF